MSDKPPIELSERDRLLLDGTLAVLVSLKGTDEEVQMCIGGEPLDEYKLQEKYGLEVVRSAQMSRQLAKAPFN